MAVEEGDLGLPAEAPRVNRKSSSRGFLEKLLDSLTASLVPHLTGCSRFASNDPEDPLQVLTQISQEALVTP
ncbi:hypothetical protein SLA2020_497590 [Shorea laevis]